MSQGMFGEGISPEDGVQSSLRELGVSLHEACESSLLRVAEWSRFGGRDEKARELIALNAKLDDLKPTSLRELAESFVIGEKGTLLGAVKLDIPLMKRDLQLAQQYEELEVDSTGHQRLLNAKEIVAEALGHLIDQDVDNGLHCQGVAVYESCRASLFRAHEELCDRGDKEQADQIISMYSEMRELYPASSCSFGDLRSALSEESQGVLLTALKIDSEILEREIGNAPSFPMWCEGETELSDSIRYKIATDTLIQGLQAHGIG